MIDTRLLPPALPIYLHVYLALLIPKSYYILTQIVPADFLTTLISLESLNELTVT
jgi:hypothetical protein